ncbi:MAG: sodium:solute symporter family protein [Synergistaceae bacterium]|nr:sodium:solute symporter family protein [Synergistaceae bacterium]
MFYFTFSAFLVIAAFCLLGVLSSRRVRDASDYAVAGRRSGAGSVVGVIMGALAGGGSTVGTVQMAYQMGLSAWWFTLGSGIGCVLLALRFAGPMRKSGLSTLPELIERSYGWPTAALTLAGSVSGTLFAVAAQFIAGIALIRSAFPLTPGAAIGALSALVLFFIFLGGLKSFSVVGNAKIAALYLMASLGAARAASLGHGPAKLLASFPAAPWWDLFAQGQRDASAGLSVALGVLCTQIYIQGVFSASDERAAKTGCLLSAALIPPLGLSCIFIGMALRDMGVEVEPALALPYFLKAYFHPALGGALWAGLVITAIGGASGLCFGVATNLSRDICSRIPRIRENERAMLRTSRCAVLLTVAVSAWLTSALLGRLILRINYLSMGLRVAGMIVPLSMAIFKPGALSRGRAFASSAAGFGGMLAALMLFPGIEPLFVGLLASVMCVILL